LYRLAVSCCPNLLELQEEAKYEEKRSERGIRAKKEWDEEGMEM